MHIKIRCSKSGDIKMGLKEELLFKRVNYNGVEGRLGMSIVQLVLLFLCLCTVGGCGHVRMGDSLHGVYLKTASAVAMLQLGLFGLRVNLVGTCVCKMIFPELYGCCAKII